MRCAVLVVLGVSTLSGCNEPCVSFCERSREQLVNNFGLPEDACENEAIAAAGNDCRACEEAFSEQFGVVAEVCGETR